MARTKQTAKKTAGIEAPRVFLKIDKQQLAAVSALQRPTRVARPLATTSPAQSAVTSATTALKRPAIMTPSGGVATAASNPVLLDESSDEGPGVPSGENEVSNQSFFV